MGTFRAALTVVALACAAVVAPATSLAEASAESRVRQEAGFPAETRTVFRFVPDLQTIQVATRITIENQVAPVVGSEFITTTVLPEYGIPVLAGSTNFTASADGGGRLSVRTESAADDSTMFVIIDLAPDLAFREVVTVNLIYEIPAGAPRSESLARINPAFATFPVFSAGDPGRTSVEVIVPDGFEIETVGDPLVPRDPDDPSVYVAENIEEPRVFTSFVVLSDNDRLATQTVSAGAQTLDIRSWPNDPAWAAFVSDLVIGGVPALEEAIGLPWPADESFEIIETQSPYLYGYAGWYTPNESSIEIGDELDPDVILHELAHLWFNADLVSGRWLNEALAEEFASIVRGRTEGVDTDPDPVERTDPGVLQLNDWNDPVFQNDLTEAQEFYGYRASWFVIDQISDEIGEDALGEVVRAAADRDIPYTGDPATEQLVNVADWRRFLDLLEGIGASEIAADVFAEHVVTDAQLRELEHRELSRSAYADLEAEGDGWTPPLELREAMSQWRFETADEQIAAVGRMLGVRDDLTVAQPDRDLTRLEEQFESSDDLAVLAATFGDADDASAALTEATEKIDSTFAPARLVADLGDGPSTRLQAAEDAFDAGDYVSAEALADRAADGAEAALSTALLRTAAALAAVAGIASLSMLGVRRRRRGRDVVASPNEV